MTQEQTTKFFAREAAKEASAEFVGATGSLRTVNDLLREIPQRWRSAEIVIGNSVGHVVKVRRVSLQKNADGRRVVMIHENDFS